MRGTSLINCKKLPEYAPNCVHCFTMLVDAITRLYIHIYRLKIGLHVSQRVLGKKLVYVDINVAARRTPCIIEMLSIISIHRHISIHRQNFIKENKNHIPVPVTEYFSLANYTYSYPFLSLFVLRSLCVGRKLNWNFTPFI